MQWGDKFQLKYLSYFITSGKEIVNWKRPLWDREHWDNGRRLVIILRKEVMSMHITFHIGKFTVTIIVKSNSCHSGK